MPARTQSVTSRLEEPTLGHEGWENDATVTHCRACHSEFGMFRWKHHCRACGLIFCDHCTSARIAVHRSHYAEGVEKQKRVCAQCFASEGETRKFLESVKELAHFPQARAVLKTHEEPDSLYLCMAALDSSGLFQARSSVCAMFGLPRVSVISVDHDDGKGGGKHFCFEPAAWSAMISASDSRNLIGQTVHVVQLRGGERVWSGAVTVNLAFGCGFGKRSSGEEYGQWQAGDIIVNGSNSSRPVWQLKDAIQIGAKITMFDYTVPRLFVNEYSSVTGALEALNFEASRCEEGLCIVQTSSQSQYFLLVRRDQQQVLPSLHSPRAKATRGIVGDLSIPREKRRRLLLTCA